MGLGTLVAGPFRLLHPHPGRAVRRHETSGWQEHGHDLVTDPGIYLITMRSTEVTIRAIAVAVDVGPSLVASGLLPHEAVHSPSVSRRLKAMRAARVDREPVLLTHPGGGLAVAAAARRPTRLLHVEQAELTVEVSRVDDADAEIVAADLARRWCLIADGHHRLSAAAAHAAECAAQVPPDPDCGIVTALIVDSDDTPLTINPIHRVLHRRGPEPLALTEVVEALRGVQPALVVAGAPTSSHPGGRSPEPGTRDEDLGEHELTVIDRADRLTIRCPPDPANGLPTTVHVVERALTRVRAATLRRLRESDRVNAMAQRRGTVAIMLPAVTHTEIFDTIAAGGLMPVKATSFQPKLPAGLVNRPLADFW